MVGMSKEAYRESGNRVVAPAVEYIWNNFGTIVIPYISITVTLEADLLLRKFLLYLYKLSWGNSDLEW